MHGTTQSLEAGRGRPLRRPPVVWFEVEDFLRYFDHFRNPTGMQRVPLEIFAEAQRIYGPAGRVRFCRLSVYTKEFMPVGFDEVISAYLNPPGAAAPWKTIWGPARFWGEFCTMLPIVIRHAGFFLWILKSALYDFIAMRGRRRRFERLVCPGDFIVALGASFGFPRYLRHIADAKRRYGIRFSLLVHDTIPVENQCFVEPTHAAAFGKWLQEALAIADVMLTVSRHSRKTLLEVAAGAGWPLPRVEVLELGGGFCHRPAGRDRRPLRFPHRFVLFVSTIEIRKNHRLLVKVWRRLLERRGDDAVPTLIFAGQIGWLVNDLLAELAASDYLGGKIGLMSDLSDGELREAYRACLFTIFPSLCEGWGLPVAESLAHGKFCLASDRTSIPEVAGGLIDYFDPADEDDALVKIERLLFDPVYLAAREARLKAEYRPRSWADCVHGLLVALDA